MAGALCHAPYAPRDQRHNKLRLTTRTRVRLPDHRNAPEYPYSAFPDGKYVCDGWRWDNRARRGGQTRDPAVASRVFSQILGLGERRKHVSHGSEADGTDVRVRRARSSARDRRRCARTRSCLRPQAPRSAYAYMQATHHNSAIKYIIVYCDSTTHVVGRGGILELARRLLARVLVCPSAIYILGSDVVVR